MPPTGMVPPARGRSVKARAASVFTSLPAWHLGLRRRRRWRRGEISEDLDICRARLLALEKSGGDQDALARAPRGAEAHHAGERRLVVLQAAALPVPDIHLRDTSRMRHHTQGQAGKA